MQVLVTLEWLLGCDHLNPYRQHCRRLDESEVQLAQALWKVLYQLLIQQLPDLCLDIKRTPSTILQCAAASLEQPALQGFPPLTELVGAALKRITQDRAQYELDSDRGQQGSQSFTRFWFFLGMVCCTTLCLPSNPGSVLEHVTQTRRYQNQRHEQVQYVCMFWLGWFLCVHAECVHVQTAVRSAVPCC